MQLDSIDNLIFDFDHTLIDTDRAFAAYRQALAEQLQLLTMADLDAIRSSILETVRRLETLFFVSRLDLMNDDFAKGFASDLDSENLHQIIDVVKRRYFDALSPGEEVLSMLNAAVNSGKNVYMLTGGSPAHTADKLIGSGLWHYFKTVFTGDFHPFEDIDENGVVDPLAYNEGMKKFAALCSLGPNPKSSAHGYELLLEKANINPDRSLMIGNHLNDDILSAQGAGFMTAQAIWFDNRTRDDLIPDVVLNSPAELFGCA